MRHFALACALFCALTSACGTSTAIGEPTDDTSSELDDTKTFTVLRSGTFSPQDEPSTAGSVSVAVSSDGIHYLVLADDFRTSFHTGSVGLFLADSDENLADQRRADAASVSSRVGRTSVTGAQKFAIPDGLDDDRFTTVVVYCEPVAINFGAAALR